MTKRIALIVSGFLLTPVLHAQAQDKVDFAKQIEPIFNTLSWAAAGEAMAAADRSESATRRERRYLVIPFLHRSTCVCDSKPPRGGTRRRQA